MLLNGNIYADDRGVITFNNGFDASEIKRIYTIENISTDFVRGWQGHKTEQRWLACMNGKFKISALEVDDFDTPYQTLIPEVFDLDTKRLDFLHIPSGHITEIKALEEHSKPLVLADYKLAEIQDEYRYP